jgi:hypothetical protein
MMLAGLAFAANARAYRPFDSTDADVAKTGQLEFEIGPVGYLNAFHEPSLVAPAIVANAGVVNRIELVLEGRNFIFLDPGPGEPRLVLGETSFSLKWLMREGSMQEQSGISLATEVGALLPTTEADTGVGASAVVIGSERWRYGMAHLNGGVFLGRTHHAGALAGLILEGPPAWPIRPVAEIFYEHEITVDTIFTGLVGFIAPVNDNLSFDGAFRMGKASDSTLAEVRAGFTWAFDW